MARCGCAGNTCSCVVEGAGAITVTGAGTAANPFVVSGGGVLTVSDTPTVNLTLSGSGSTGSPYVLSAVAEVALDELTDVDVAAATTGQVLAKQGDGQWRGVPAPTAAPGILTVGNGLDGDGSAGSPLVVDETELPGWGAWTAYSPALTATVANPTIGNGQINGRYRLQGKTVDFMIEVLIGSTTKRGSGFWRLSLPFAPRSDGLRRLAYGHLGAVGVGDYSGVSVFESQTIQRLHFSYTSLDVPLSHGWPTTLAAGSRIMLNGTYEID